MPFKGVLNASNLHFFSDRGKSATILAPADNLAIF
jgi:hypothetical protein